MEHQDAEVSDITIVLKKECADKFNATVEQVKNLDMTVESTDADNGVIEGTVPADKLSHIRAWPCVEYVRVDFTYIADYPPGDPRNRDKDDDDSQVSVG
ncbi:MAG TPA: hypothetical protein VFE47_25080 [Tepidisphaeraceae bacterium]|jgi:hypothetical protein|nr:hypothetical protein [Tepidisphaeraceae bacterium]